MCLPVLGPSALSISSLSCDSGGHCALAPVTSSGCVTALHVPASQGFLDHTELLAGHSYLCSFLTFPLDHLPAPPSSGSVHQHLPLLRICPRLSSQLHLDIDQSPSLGCWCVDLRQLKRKGIWPRLLICTSGSNNPDTCGGQGDGRREGTGHCQPNIPRQGMPGPPIKLDILRNPLPLLPF